jgi:exopolyphosphatase/pppGpp-phosphohydrolase
LELITALDLGSGTIKWSVFGRGAGHWRPLRLEEANTELRKGMGTELTLKPGPILDTVAACRAYLDQCAGLGLGPPPAYGTSALRKARNPEVLLEPLHRLGVHARILSEDEEGRLNLLGLLAGVGPASAPFAPMVVDPGGDSTELCADLRAGGWQAAQVASLPFGSVSLQELHGSSQDNRPLPWGLLEGVVAETEGFTARFAPAGPFLGRALLPAIRMNMPIQAALERVNGRNAAEHGRGGLYGRGELEALARETAARDHAGRAALLAGEPMGKVDRTCYGFASWLGILRAFKAESFTVEPWGIKLGAALHLNHVQTGIHG